MVRVTVPVASASEIWVSLKAIEVIVGAAVSLTGAAVACVAALPARSLTLAVTVRVVSDRPDRSSPAVDHSPPLTVAVPETVLVPSLTETLTVCPSSAFEVPEMTTASSSAALMRLSVAIVPMVRVGARVSLIGAAVACVAGLPAASLTLAVTVRVVSVRPDRFSAAVDQVPPVTVAVPVTVLVPSLTETLTVCPSSAFEVPEMTTASSSAALMRPSEMVLMASVGGAVSSVAVTAAVAEAVLAASSVTVRLADKVPSASAAICAPDSDTGPFPVTATLTEPPPEEVTVSEPLASASSPETVRLIPAAASAALMTVSLKATDRAAPSSSAEMSRLKLFETVVSFPARSRSTTDTETGPVPNALKSVKSPAISVRLPPETGPVMV